MFAACAHSLQLRAWARQPIIPWREFIEILLVAGMFLGFQVGKAQFHRCEWRYWVLLGVQIVLMAGVSFYAIYLHEHSKPLPIAVEHSALLPDEEQPAVAAQQHAGSWIKWHLVVVWLLVLVIGVIAGMVGLGGGVLISPLLLELKAHPQTAAATSTFIVLFSSTTAAITFGLGHRLNLDYTAVYGPVCLVGGFLGVFILSGLVRRWQMASLVTFTLAVLVIVSAGLVAGFAGREAVTDLVNGIPVTVGGYCSA